MDVFLLILRLALAGVFGVAGVAKAFDRPGSAKAFADFGVPKPIANVLVYLLPAFELAVAISLLFIKTSWYGAVGAAGLLLIFTAGMLYQLAKGNAPNCHCFGQIHSEPVGISSIVRNIVLLIPAGILSVQGQSAQGLAIVNGPQDGLTVGVGVLLSIIGLIAILYLKTILHQQNQLIRQMEFMELVEPGSIEVERDDVGHPREGLPLGALVPEFAGVDIYGNEITLADIKSDGLPVLFLFISPTCASCNALSPEFDEWEDEFRGRMKLVFMSELSAEENIAKYKRDGRLIILQESGREIASILRAKWTPMAVLMNRHGRIASFTGPGDVGIRELVGKIQNADLNDDFVYITGRDSQPFTRIRMGETIPPLDLMDINGRRVSTDELKGKAALLAFWSPTCSYCLPMMEQFKTWETSKNGVDPHLVVFAEGDGDEYKKYGLQSPIVSDPHSKIGNRIGRFGAPSGIMIDEQGRFISETVVGAADIWSLVGKTPEADG